MLLRSPLSSLLLLIAFFSQHAVAKNSAFDVIPENAAAGFAIKNISELKAKGTKLVEATGVDLGMKPSEAFDSIYGHLGIGGDVDESKSAAVVLAGCIPAGKLTGWGPLEYIVGVIPFKDRDKIAARFGFKKGELKPDAVAKVPKPRFVGEAFAYARGNHLIIGPRKDAVLDVALAKPMSGSLSKSQRRLASADLVVHIDGERLGDELAGELREVRRDLKKIAKSDDELKAIAPLLDVVEDIGTVTLAGHVDDGVRIGLLAKLKKDARDSSRKALAKIRGGDEASDLAGLPVGRVLAGSATRSDGSVNGRLATLAMHVLTREFLNSFASRGLPDATDIISANEQSYFVGVFTQVWHRLNGSKFAVYQNPDPAKQGMFSVVAILDTKDPDEFLKEMKELARFSDPKGFGLVDGKPQSDDEAEIKRLIAQLGDDSFRKREAATLKLELIGLAARPYIEKLLDAKDPEVKYRAQVVKAHIDRMEKQSRTELLANNPIKRVKPSFAYFKAYEGRNGRAIDVIGCKLTGEEAPAAAQLQKYFGSDWNKLRVARHDKQLVVLFGSNTELFDKAVDNVASSKPGIVKSKAMAGFSRRSIPSRKAELHFAIKDVLPLAADGESKKAADTSTAESPTSLSVSIEEAQLQFDLWFPNSEIKALSAANKRWFGFF